MIFSKIRIFSVLPGLLLPGQNSERRRPKGPGKALRGPFFCPREKRRWPRARRDETAESRIGKGGTSPFFREGNALPSGHGTNRHTENLQLAELMKIEKSNDSIQ